MKKSLYAILIIIIILLVIGIKLDFINLAPVPSKIISQQKDTKKETNQATPDPIPLGTSHIPAHFPNPSPEDVENLFTLSTEMGSNHMMFMTEWVNDVSVEDIIGLQQLVTNNNQDFYLVLSPIALTAERDQPDIPDYVNGNSFTDSEVREAFIAKALEYASYQPTYLGLGAEVNLLAANPTEFEAYTSLTQETYNAIKQQYPNQDITISFQWDQMSENKEQYILSLFENSLDVYSFTVYPQGNYQNPNTIPYNYISSIRNTLPNARIGISEIGWSAPIGSPEEIKQSAFFADLPEKLDGLNLEFVTLSSIHDTNFFKGGLESFNYLGIRTFNSEPKLAWDVIKNYITSN